MVVPVRAPENPVNVNPLFVVAVTGTTVPLFTHSLAGVMPPSKRAIFTKGTELCVPGIFKSMRREGL